MKKLVTLLGLSLSLLIATPAFAYTVKSGDTMTGIAKYNQMTLQQLSKANPQIKNYNLIYVGQEVVIPSKEEQQPKQLTPATVDEKDLLARLVRAEAVGEPYDGKVAVAVVVLNRVDHGGFPNSIKEVIYQDRQFTPVSNGEINTPADAESIKAVEEALTLNRLQGAGSLFFYNPSIATSRWLDTRPTTTTIGNHVFKK